MLTDVRHGVRVLLKNKGWTAVVLLSLALGIGANLAIFNAIDAVLLRKLPVKDPDSLVRFGYAGKNDMATGINSYGPAAVDPSSGNPLRYSFSSAMFDAFRANSHTTADLTGCAPIGRVNVVSDSSADVATGLVVAGNYFPLLGVSASMGRTLLPSDDSATASPVAVLSAQYWRTRFASDPQIIGQGVRVNGVPVTIVGVLPEDFTGVQQTTYDDRDITLPLALYSRLNPPAPNARPREAQQTFWWVEVLARLKPGATVDSTRADLEPLFQRMARSGLDDYLARLTDAQRSFAQNRNRSAVPHLIVDSASQGVYNVDPADIRSIKVLASAVVLVLLIVCANVANLQLSRSVTRRTEMSIRLSLGATRARIVRQLLTESLLLSGTGAALGLLVGAWVQAMLPGSLSRVAPLDWRLVAFLIGVTTVTGIAFGLTPALTATRIDVNTALKASGRSMTESRGFLGRALLVVQVSVSLALLVGAGSFVRTVNNLRHVDVGFDPRNIVLFRVLPRASGYDTERAAALYANMLDRLGAMPGVRSVSLSSNALLGGTDSVANMFVQGGNPEGSRNDVFRLDVSPNFFQAMGIPLTAGRAFNAFDAKAAPKVAVINEATARAFFGSANPVGRRFGLTAETSAEIEVVGVVRDAKYDEMRQPAPPTMYMSYMQSLPGNPAFEVRTAGDPLNTVSAIRDVVRRIDPSLPISAVSTQADAIEARFEQERTLAVAYATFGGLALLVASIGLFGLMSYKVARRTGEIGIRMALGAEPGTVLGDVMMEAMRIVTVGIAVGLALTFATGRVVASLLYGVAPTSATTIGVAAAVLVAVSAAASYLPARRASRVDPLVALRSN